MASGAAGAKLSGVKLTEKLFGVNLTKKLFGVKGPGVKLSAVCGIWCWWCGELRVGMVSGGDLKKMPETKSSPSSPHRKLFVIK